jgi:nitrate/TMAO reductase-like tetraheme cytochrome c subunit
VSARARRLALPLGLVAILVVGGALAFEPLTRQVIAGNGLCAYCHVPQEYQSQVRLAYSRPHPAAKEDGELPQQARCVECHLPTGLVSTVFAYTHFASLTDLFGRFRHRNVERAGAWLPPRQAAAYRVRDGLAEDDSSTCRACHDMDEIEPKRERGVNAHKEAVEEDKTCIACHYNETHRAVALRE